MNNLRIIQEQICKQQAVANINNFNGTPGTHSFFSEGKCSVTLGSSTTLKSVPVISSFTRIVNSI